MTVTSEFFMPPPAGARDAVIAALIETTRTPDGLFLPDNAEPWGIDVGLVNKAIEALTGKADGGTAGRALCKCPCHRNFEMKHKPDGCYCKATQPAAPGMGDGGRITHFLRKFGLKGLENLSGWPTSYGESCDTERMIENGNLLRDFDEWIGYDALAAQPAPIQSELPAWATTLIAALPLLDETGLDEGEHCCEWTLQRERKRILAAILKVSRELQEQPAPVVGGADFHTRFQRAANVICATYRREVGKGMLLSVAELLAYDVLKADELLSARPGGDDRRVFIEGYMEAAHSHAHGSTPISAIEHHARLAADKAGYRAHPTPAGGDAGDA
jgi:hypothetical protein